MNKISIIVPIYNLELFFVKRCISSIISQSYENWELIIVDDASDQKYDHSNLYNNLKCDNRIKIIKNITNLGLAESRNIGYYNSTGNYIWFIDGDDYIAHKNVFIEIIDIFKNNKFIEFINFEYITLFFKKNKFSSNKWSELYFNNHNNFDFKYFNRMHTVWRNVYKKQFIDMYGIMHQKYNVKYEDIFWDLQIKSYFNVCYITKKEFLVYDKTRLNSITNNKNIELDKETFVNNLNYSFNNIYSFDNDEINVRFFVHLLYFYEYFPFLQQSIIDKLKFYVKNNVIKLSILQKISILIASTEITKKIYWNLIKLFIKLKRKIT